MNNDPICQNHRKPFSFGEVVPGYRRGPVFETWDIVRHNTISTKALTDMHKKHTLLPYK